MTANARLFVVSIAASIAACSPPAMLTDASADTATDVRSSDAMDTTTPTDTPDVPDTTDAADVSVPMDVIDAADANDLDVPADITTPLDATGDGDATTDVVCVGTLAALELPANALYVMFDQSGSMSDVVTGGGTRWDAATAGLNSFVTASTSSGLSVGLQYFPLVSSSCPASCSTDADCGADGPCFFGMCQCALGGDSCNVSDYTPPAVEIATLPGGSSSITSSLAAHMPTNATPTGPALSGAIAHAHSWAVAHPGHRVAVVLVTDGEPNECTPMDVPGVAAIAASGLSGVPSVPTFVVVIGPDAPMMDAVAVSGGTARAHRIDTGSDVTTQVRTALDEVRAAQGACSFAAPTDADGGTIDPALVNVVYAAPGAAPTAIPHVTDGTACPPSGDAWYWDSTARITLCDSFCSRVYNESGSTLQVQTGCATRDLSP